MKVAFVGAGVGGGGGGGYRNRKLNNQHAFFMDLACYKLCKSLAYHSRESCNGCILFFSTATTNIAHFTRPPDATC